MLGYDWPRFHAAVNDLPAALLFVTVLFDLGARARENEEGGDREPRGGAPSRAGGGGGAHARARRLYPPTLMSLRIADCGLRNERAGVGTRHEFPLPIRNPKSAIRNILLLLAGRSPGAGRL